MGRRLRSKLGKSLSSLILGLASEYGIVDKKRAIIAALVLDIAADLALAPFPLDPLLASPLVFLITWFLLRRHYKEARSIALLAAFLSALAVP